MAERTGNGGKVTNLGPLAATLSRLRGGLYEAPPDTIAGISSDGWYSPLQPVAPINPENSGPKAFQYNAGQNQTYTPRFDSEFSAADLKNLAKYDLARVLIENVKDQIAHTPWEIHARRKPGEPGKDHKKREAGDDNIVALSRFFECPDGENSWPDWVRPLLEDMLVIDAGSVLLRTTGNNTLAELRVIRGESITRYIDNNGWTPKPPSPAYAQNWWGMPLVNLTTDQLVYKPRNIVPRVSVASQLYGMSPVEQAAQWIKIGALRLNFQEAYYTEGAIPGVLHVVPPGITADQITESMQAINSAVAGNFTKRRGWQTIQGFKEEGDDQIIFGKEALLTDPFDELLIRCLCFAFGTSPQRLMKMMNRASAESGQEAADIEGLLPYLNWLKTSVINYIIQQKMGFVDYEMTFDTAREADPKSQMETDSGYVRSGIKKIDEVREKLGLDESGEPNAAKLGIVTPTGFVPLDTPIPDPNAPALGPDGKPVQPGNKKPGADDDEPEPTPSGGKPTGSARNTTGSSRNTGSERNTSGSGKGGAAKKALTLAKASTVEDAPLIDTDKLAVKTEVYISNMSTRLARWFKQSARDAGQAIIEARGADTILKAADDEKDEPLDDEDLEAEILLAGKKLTPIQRNSLRALVLLAWGTFKWETIPAKFSRYFSGAGEQGVDIGVAQVQAKVAAAEAANSKTPAKPKPGSTTAENKPATDYSEVPDSETLESDGLDAVAEFVSLRVAEMVGMKYAADGKTLVPNADAKWTITDATRKDLVNSVAQAIEEGWTANQLAAVLEAGSGFSPDRADLIARTELSRAQAFGNYITWQLTGLAVFVIWQTSEDEGVCVICNGFEDQGVVPLGHEFAPGIEYPTAHPRCRCALRIVDEEDEE